MTGKLVEVDMRYHGRAYTDYEYNIWQPGWPGWDGAWALFRPYRALI